MKRFATLSLVLGLASGGSTAIAAQAKDQVSNEASKPEPMLMTEAQLDNVAAGLIFITVVDAVDVNRNDVVVAIPVQLQNINANLVASVLGTAVNAPTSTQTGNQTQRFRNRQ